MASQGFETSEKGLLKNRKHWKAEHLQKLLLYKMTHKVIPLTLLVTPEENDILDQKHSDVADLFLGKTYDTFYQACFVS